MKKMLYLIRHAQAEELGNSLMVRDRERDLTSRGIMQSARIGNYLKQNGFTIEMFISSPANRAFQTAKMIAEQLKHDTDKIILDTNLYGAGARGYLATVNDIPEDINGVALFGHNPDISFFAEYLTRDDTKGSMKKASVLILTFENLKWTEISSKSGSLLERIDVENIVVG